VQFIAIHPAWVKTEQLVAAAKARSLRGMPGGWKERKLIEFLQMEKTPISTSGALPMPPHEQKGRDRRGRISKNLAPFP
jgi:hypothetical protein